jgi:hypothetical protein
MRLAATRSSTTFGSGTPADFGCASAAALPSHKPIASKVKTRISVPLGRCRRF